MQPLRARQRGAQGRPLSPPAGGGSLPYGSWPSPITPERLVEHVVRLSQVSQQAGVAYWNEGRPSEAGRQVVVADAGGERRDVFDEGFSARTQVHEYGGRSYCVVPGGVVFSNWGDQRLHLVRPGGEPVALTAAPPLERAVRFADMEMTPDGTHVVCVRERHGQGAEAVNDLVAVPLDPTTGSPPLLLASGHDFYGAPRLSPDGRRLAFVTWDHPSMPWDSSTLWVAEVSAGASGAPVLGEPSKVAGGPGESITQPRWSPTGVLHFVSDRSGWWNLYDETGRALCPRRAEFGQPDWVFGNSTYCFLPDGRLVAVWSEDGAEHIGFVADGRCEEALLPFSVYDSLAPGELGLLCLAASATHPLAVVRLDLDGGRFEVLRPSREVDIDRAYLSVPEAIVFPTGAGQEAHALFYPPVNPECAAPPGELPPLVVTVHGGPTSSTAPVLNLGIQFWTTRGFAVADVDYRGSSGYGRAYRELLKRDWGIADVEDCAAVVAHLAATGRVDGARAVIRGGSAGGFTTLAALAFTDAFAAGASHYGVADLELLTRDTHKFESRYLDGLIGPYPEAIEEYRRRSPIYHVEQITSPLILFQGLEDVIVPPEQAEMIYEALRRRGVPVAYLPFEGEQHGFRKAATIVTVAEAELVFYGRVLGFTPAGGAGAGLEIANAEALGR